MPGGRCPRRPLRFRRARSTPRARSRPSSGHHSAVVHRRPVAPVAGGPRGRARRRRPPGGRPSRGAGRPPGPVRPPGRRPPGGARRPHGGARPHRGRTLLTTPTDCAKPQEPPYHLFIVTMFNV